MSADEVVPETQGVSSALLGVIDLGAEIPAMAGYQLRTRLFTFAPGAVFGPLHDHVGRPGTVVSGTVLVVLATVPGPSSCRSMRSTT